MAENEDGTYPGGWVQMEVRSDIGGLIEVVISRSLDEGNGWEADDPALDIKVTRANKADFLEHLRASDLDDLIRALQQARDTARRFRILPPPLGLKERFERAMDEDPVPPSPPEPPKAAGRDDEFDAGDMWKRGTIYDHTM